MNPTQELELRPPRRRYAAHLAVPAAFTALGAVLAANGSPGGWLVAIGFGTATAAVAVAAHPAVSSLRLAPDRFTVRALSRTRSYRWRDVAEFGVGTFGLQRVVAFTFSDDFKRGRDITPLSGGLSPFEGALPDTYGLRASDLARLMNEWRERQAGAPSLRSLP